MSFWLTVGWCVLGALLAAAGMATGFRSPITAVTGSSPAPYTPPQPEPPPLADPADATPDRVQLGAHAKRLLDDPVLALALDRIDRQLAETWRDSAVGASEEREAAYRLHWAVERLRVELRTLLNNAKQIEAEQKRKDDAERRERERRERWVA